MQKRAANFCRPPVLFRFSSLLFFFYPTSCQLPFSTAFASVGRAVPENYFVEAPLFLETVPVTEFAVPGTSEMVRAIEPYTRQTNNLLLKNHGALVWDKNLEAAYNRLEVLEAVCRMAYYTEALGGADVILPDQMERLRQAKQKKDKT